MKTIYLIRHAEASSAKPNESDFQRHLNQQGENEASLIGKKLNDLGVNLDYIVCSAANRTRETAFLLCEQLNYPINTVQFDKNIYEAPLTNLTQAINKIPSQFNEVALIAHNPSITYLANYLTDNYINHIPTCGVVKIELEINNWDEIIQGIGLQKFFIYPKMF
jgi:phosphohistidine phosphatase